METIGLGDLATSLQSRRNNARLNNELVRLTQELSSGRRTDVTSGVSGDFGPLAAFRRDLSAIESFTQTAQEARLIAQAGQEVLGQIATGASDDSTSLLLVVTNPDPELVEKAAASARQNFEAAIAGLNTNVAGRSVFAGQDFGNAATIDADTILADLVLATAAETTAAGVEAIVDAYFAPGGGFETTAYLGDVAATPTRLGSGETADPTLLATDPRITQTLAETAKAALIDLDVLIGQPDERILLAGNVGQSLLEASANLTDARAAVGIAEEALERSLTRLAAEKTSTEIALGEIVNADPFETAARLQETEVQLETLYILTGRLAALSLANFLR
ncbi:MAG: flagellin [Pseudomonadota bacterium]